MQSDLSPGALAWRVALPVTVATFVVHLGWMVLAGQGRLGLGLDDWLAFEPVLVLVGLVAGVVLCVTSARAHRAAGVGLLLGTLAGGVLVIGLVVADLAACCTGSGTV